MSGRRALFGCVAGCVGLGLAVVVVAGATWDSGTFTTSAGAHVHVAVSGSDALPGLAAVGWAVVVLGLGVLASRGWLRRVVGVLVFGAGAGIVALAATAHATADAMQAALTAKGVGAAVHTPTLTVWAVLELLLGLCVMALGLGTARAGGRWPGLGSRYDAPARPVDPARSAWEALDRGEDPTA